MCQRKGTKTGLRPQLDLDKMLFCLVQKARNIAIQNPVKKGKGIRSRSPFFAPRVAMLKKSINRRRSTKGLGLNRRAAWGKFFIIVDKTNSRGKRKKVERGGEVGKNMGVKSHGKQKKLTQKGCSKAKWGMKKKNQAKSLGLFSSMI